MLEEEEETLIRQYAAGQISWHELQEPGFADSVQVLAGLGELDLRPPVAAMEGPNVDARLRGRAIIRDALRVRK
jgi:hypothetical protein